VDGKTYSSADFAPGPLVVMFLCNHCPYVKAVEDRLIRLAREYAARGVQYLGICANDAAGYPDDAFDKLAARWRDKGYGFPYLHDESQAVALTFGAVCTPDIFVYDRSRRLAYRGRIDDSWKDESKVTRRELAAALDALLGGGQPAAEQRPSLGCSIKWKD
jgi:thiol-disulfide isomerase/thioredoxin